MSDTEYPIQLAARLTGLSPYVLRIWEQRYRAVEPRRTATNRRLYAQRDIERLNLLRDATQAGHSIGQVAHLPTDRLGRLLAASTRRQTPLVRDGVGGSAAAEGHLDACLNAIKSLDEQALAEALKRAWTALGAMGMLQRVAAPLAQNLGQMWREGAFTAAHEHFATAAIRVFLANSGKPFGAVENGPAVVAATPTGQVHELGALLAGATAGHLGWRVIYLGASLPAAEIAGAARQARARAVALSLVYPEDDPDLPGELTRLRELLPAGVALLVGGRAMPAYRQALEKIGALPVEDLARLGATLDSLRKPAERTKP